MHGVHLKRTNKRSKRKTPRRGVHLFHKGAIMKWWWVLIMVLLVPVGSPAKEFMDPAVTINIEGAATDWPQKGVEWEDQKFTFFVVEPKEPLHDVSIHMEFSVPGRSGHHLEPLHAARCGVLFVNSDQTTVQVFSTRNGDDLDLWIPHFAVGTEIGVVVGWNDTTKDVWTASLTIQSTEGRQSHRWENWVVQTENSPRRPTTLPKWLGTEDYPLQTVPLGAVCNRLHIAEQPRSPS